MDVSHDELFVAILNCRVQKHVFCTFSLLGCVNITPSKKPLRGKSTRLLPTFVPWDDSHVMVFVVLQVVPQNQPTYPV